MAKPRREKHSGDKQRHGTASKSDGTPGHGSETHCAATAKLSQAQMRKERAAAKNSGSFLCNIPN